jgi:hypothetical protein
MPTFTPTTVVAGTVTPTPTVTPTTVVQTLTPAAIGLQPVKTAGSVSLPEDNQDKQSPQHKETEEQRQQRQHTNTGNRDDVSIEGNVVAVEKTADGKGLLVTIAMTRNETQIVQVPCFGLAGEVTCPDIQVGDYLEADGYQNGVGDQDSYFVASDGVEVTRDGKRLK